MTRKLRKIKEGKEMENRQKEKVRDQKLYQQRQRRDKGTQKDAWIYMQEGRI